MPTTRSQTHGSGQPSSHSTSSRFTTDTKRKASSTKSSPAKKARKEATKQAKLESDSGEIDTKVEDDKNSSKDDESDETITINRAPVLELWSACVAQTLYPSLAWSTCLSAGSAISTLAAISKGRAIGKIDKPDKTEQAAKKQQKSATQDDEVEELEIMSFHLKVNNGEVLVGDKTKKGNEETLKKKYGGEDVYEKAKQTMLEALEGWKGKEDELNQSGFHMYEDFRPSVASGQKGWGRKGSLRLKSIRNAVAG